MHRLIKKFKQAILWHHIYYLLAFINFMTIAVTLLLSSQIMSIYQDSVEKNKQMSMVVSEFIKLNYIAKELHKPAIRVFLSRDVEFERESLRQSKIWFSTSYKHAVNNFNETFGDHQFIQVAEEIALLRSSMSIMLVHTVNIFNAIEANDLGLAGKYLAKMDASHYKITAAIGDISHFVSEQQNKHFEQQIALAKRIKFYELMIAIFVLCMVIIVASYGKALGKRLKADSVALEKSAKEAQELAEIKSTFLANMSHEIRTPMNGITNLLKLIDEEQLTQQDREYLRLASASTKNLMVIINDILDISKIDQGKLLLEERNFEVIKVVEEQIQLQKSAKNIGNVDITTCYPDNVNTYVLGDSVRLSQVINNLLSNALKFTKNGKVTVSVELRPSIEKPEDVAVILSVKDSGIGIPADKISGIFEAFVQTDSSTTREFGGTGLGLPISKQLCQNMGGDLIATSQINVGSEFTASFLFKVGEEVKQTAASKVNSLQDIELNLLVAEDNKINQVVISALLKKCACSFDIVDNGEKVLQKLKQAHDYDVILMDCLMPVMDGYEASEKIRAGSAGEENRKIPIIAVTANSMESDIQRCKSAGMDNHIAKPIVPETLYQALESLQTELKQEA